MTGRLFAALALLLGLLAGPVGAVGADASGPRTDKLLVVVLENHAERNALASMPALAGMARAYGYTTDYRAARHPSLPNYLAIAGGSTFGVTDDAGPSAHSITGPSVFDAALARGRTAKTYAESMPAACSPTTTNVYAGRHNPWVYFSDPASRANCRRLDVPAGTSSAGALHDDVLAGALPTVGMLVPNICNDAHSCPLATADAWLSDWLRVVQAGPDWRSGRLAVVVTFDEDDGSQANAVLTTVLAPATSHLRVDAPLTHYSLARLAAEVAGAAPLHAAGTAPSMAAAFGLRTGTARQTGWFRPGR